MRLPSVQLGRFLLAPLAFVACSLSQITRAEFAMAQDAPLKPARSDFDLREFSDFINFDLSVPRPRGPLQREGRLIRTLVGQVVDHAGAPIVGAQVVFTEPIGQGTEDFDENYDKTDELGRFFVEGDELRERLVVRRGDGLVWNVPVATDDRVLRVQWPAPGRVTIVIDPELLPPGSEIGIVSVEYWAGMSPLRRKATTDASGAAIVDDLLPGTFRVVANRPLVTDEGGREYAAREFGQFTIAAGQQQELRFAPEAMIPVVGKTETPGACVIVQRQRTRYLQNRAVVDGVFCDDAGAFVAHVLGPGWYCLTVKMRPAPENSRQGGFREVVPPPIHRVRFVVDESTTTVAVDFDKPRDPTVEFVHRTLDSDGPLNVSWSHTDVQAAMLVGHADRAGVAAELLRILGDDQAPHDWKYPTLQALGGMTETPGVTEGLLALLAKPAGGLRPGQLFAPLHRATEDLDRIVDAVSAYNEDEDWRTRWGVQYYLGRMAHEHPQLKDRVIPLLLAGLRDPVERIRSGAAATLGWLDAKQAADDLRALRDDPNDKVRLWAARAMWQTSGDPQPLVEIATDLLNRENDDYEAKKDAAYALREVDDIPQEAIDALTRYAGNQDKPPFNDRKALLQYQLGRIARGVLERQDY